ncbi:MAG: hypothetical protein ABW134_11760 [Candidatus Thiodiazotropha endolucinida]
MFLRLNKRLFDDDPAPGGGGGTPPADPPSSDPPPSDHPADPTPSDPPADPPPADPPKPFYQALPDDWRKQIAGDDEKRLKQMERYTDLPALIKAGFEAKDRISKGEISNGLPENPTDEQLAAWREANGVPEAPDKYEFKLDEGLVMGEADKRIAEGVREVAHQLNIPNESLSALNNAMMKGREAEAQAKSNQDGLDKQACDRQLQEAWGGDYQTNVNLALNQVSQLPESVRENFINARMADGKGLMNSPEIMNWLVDIQRKVNPVGTVVPNSNNPMQDMNTEIAKLEARMGDDDWHKDIKAQNRYQELIDAREQYNSQHS